MTVLTRVNPKEIDQIDYKKFLANDRELAKVYAFDVGMHLQNKVTLNYEEIEIEVLGEGIDVYAIEEQVELILRCDYPLAIRIDKILGQKLGVSRTQVKNLAENGHIHCFTEKDIIKKKVKREVVLHITSSSKN